MLKNLLSFFKMSHKFGSNEELFDAIKNFIAQLEQSGKVESARKLREGYACLNGLTDGWALLLESLDAVLATDLQSSERSQLKEIQSAVKRIVFR